MLRASFPDLKLNNNHIFANLSPDNDEAIWEQLDSYLQFRNPWRYRELHEAISHNLNNTHLSLIKEEVEYDSDESFPEEAFRLTQEIKANVKKLRAMGVNELLIRNLFKKELAISHLRITKDFQFILTDYHDKEVADALAKL